MNDPHTSIWRSAWHGFFRWAPRAMTPPAIDPALTELPVLQRIAEVLQFQIRSFLYSVSPGGQLLAVLKILFAVGIIVGISTVILGWILSALLALLNCLAAILGILLIAGILLSFLKGR